MFVDVSEGILAPIQDKGLHAGIEVSEDFSVLLLPSDDWGDLFQECADCTADERSSEGTNEHNDDRSPQPRSGDEAWPVVDDQERRRGGQDRRRPRDVLFPFRAEDVP